MDRCQSTRRAFLGVMSSLAFAGDAGWLFLAFGVGFSWLLDWPHLGFSWLSESARPNRDRVAPPRSLERATATKGAPANPSTNVSFRQHSSTSASTLSQHRCRSGVNVTLPARPEGWRTGTLMRALSTRRDQHIQRTPLAACAIAVRRQRNGSRALLEQIEKIVNVEYELCGFL